MRFIVAVLLSTTAFADEYEHTPFDPDPDHLWNRIHSVFFIRVATDGTRYTAEELDPPLALKTLYPLTSPAHEKIVAMLDEFIDTNAATQISDPLKRAIFQRDLWAVFDWTTDKSRIAEPGRNHPESRSALQTRLATIIRQVALTREEIEGLPDNYKLASSSGRFPAAHNPATPEAAFLPPGLTEAAESWLLLSAGPRVGLSARTSLPSIATDHTQASMGRSVFYVYGQFPNDPGYLKRLRDFPTPLVPSGSGGSFLFNPELPQFPAGSQFILLRRTLLIDASGALVLSPLTESVQIRVYVTEPKNDMLALIGEFSQEVYAFVLDRNELFSGKSGGLRLVTNDDLTLTTPPFDFWPAETRDLVETPPSYFRRRKIPPLHTCKVCHSGSGIRSVRIYTFFQRLPPNLMTNQDLTWEAERTMNRKEQHYSWGLLQGLWKDR